MVLVRSLGVLITLLSPVTFILGVANVALTCTQIVVNCTVDPISSAPVFLFLTYTGAAIWASVLIGGLGLYATCVKKRDKKQFSRIATLSFLSCALFAPAMIGINGVEAYYFQTVYPVSNYTLSIDDQNLIKFSINVATASVGLIAYIPLFLLLAYACCCPNSLLPISKKKKVSSTSKSG